MTKQELIKHKQIQIHKYKHAYSRTKDKLSAQGRFLRNKFERYQMELGELLYG